MPIKRLRKKIRKYITFNPVNWFRSMHRIGTMVDEWISTAATPQHASNGSSFAILVTPWSGTFVPWYSIVVGLLLAARGVNVVFIFDNLPFGRTPYRSAFTRFCIRHVLGKLSNRYDVLKLTDYLRGEGMLESGEALIAKLATLNAVHELRGEMVVDGRAKYEALVHRQLSAADPGIQRLLQQHSFCTIFIPGGVWGTSGLWRDRAARAGVRVSSYDAGGSGVLMLATDGVASQLQDIPRAFSSLKNHVVSQQEDAFILRIARAELEKRHQGKDAFNSQLVASSTGLLDKYRGAVLLALNSSWDQAVLGLNVVFENNINWISETVQWVLDNTNTVIVVRQHPHERMPGSTSDNYGTFLHQHFGNHKRVLFIAAGDPINTYELLSVVSTVIANTSTIGVEAAALGKQVIVHSRCYYAGLGFVWSASSRSDYFELIEKSLAGKLALTHEMRIDAAYCYYITQVCNWIYSPFSPESYSLWSKESVISLGKYSSVQLILSALVENVPAALLNHRNRMAVEPLMGGF